MEFFKLLRRKSTRNNSAQLILTILCKLALSFRHLMDVITAAARKLINNEA